MTIPIPYYHDEDAGITLYLGDCREIAPVISTPDVVLTDPPYRDCDVPGDYREWFSSWWKSLQFNDYAIHFNGSTRIFEIAQMAGLPHRVLMWTKGVVCYAYRWEPVFIHAAANPSYKINSLIFTDHLPYQPISSVRSCHQYEKPLNLMLHLLRYIPEDKTILDPCAGSGTTLVACKHLHRKAIGIEEDEADCSLIVRRLAQEVLPL